MHDFMCVYASYCGNVDTEFSLWIECWHLIKASISSRFQASGPCGPTGLQEFEPEVLFLAFGFDGMKAFEHPREDPASYRKK